MFGRKEQAPNEVAAPPAASAFVYKVDEKQDRERDSPEDFTGG
jgi:hypothetical protein